MTCPLGDRCLSLYTLEEEGYKQNSLFGTITISSTCCNLVMYALISWVGPPQMVRPMYHLVVLGVYTPTEAVFLEFCSSHPGQTTLASRSDRLLHPD
jgi:hypothetical protein